MLLWREEMIDSASRAPLDTYRRGGCHASKFLGQPELIAHNTLTHVISQARHDSQTVNQQQNLDNQFRAGAFPLGIQQQGYRSTNAI